MPLLLQVLLACSPTAPERPQPDPTTTTSPAPGTATGGPTVPTTPGTTPTGSTPTGTTTPSPDTGDTGTTTPPVDTGPPADDGCGVPRIRINEVSPSNGSAVEDADGDTPDWIEIYNGTFDEVDLTGWHLSDDDDDPLRWTFPPMFLDPGETAIVFASGKDAGEPVASWRTVVDHGDLWSYLPVVAPPPDDWAEPDFDDGDWAVGPSGFGRGDGDDATEVDAHTVYIRTDVALAADDLDDLAALWLHVDHDDGFVAWLNGDELVRDGVEGADPAWDAWVSDGGQEAQLYQGRSAPGYDVSFAIDRLREGRNVLAIEVHDASAHSSDLSLIPFLTLGFRSVRPGAPSAELDFGRREDAPHTNFKLSLSGEPVVLSAPDGCVVDRVEAIELRQDESWGRMPDGGALGVFLEPTPGERNTTEWRPGFASAPVLRPEPGFYPSGTAVSALSDNPDAIVRVELGGAVPTEGSPRYMPGIGTSGEGTVVRARAFADGLWPSRVATGTYLVRTAPTLPVVTIAIEPDDFLGPENGMYVHYLEDWEREAHIAMFEPGGGDGFALDAGLKIHGAASRHWGQKSLRLVMRSDYGTSAVEYDLFDETDQDRHERLILRNAGHDALGCSSTGCVEGSHLKDALAHRLVADIDIDSMASRPVLAYVNGEHWGLYNLRERLDTNWIANNHGADEVDILEWEYSVVEGDNDHWIAFMNTLRVLDPLSDEAWEHVDTHLDVAEVANYHASQILIANVDWPGNNKKWWRPRTPDGKYRFLLYDTDFGLGRGGVSVAHDTLAFALAPDGSGPNAPWATELLRLLIEIPRFREEFVNRYADLLNTSFSAEEAGATLDGFIAERERAMPEHLERWGNNEALGFFQIGIEVWEVYLDRLDPWLRDRPFHARIHLEDNLGLPGRFELTLETTPPATGRFQLAAVEVGDGFQGTYFLENPVRVEAVPEDGFVFVGWDDPRLPDDPVVWVDGEDGDTVLTARFE